MDQQMRKQIAKSFNAEVFDLYGSKELGNIAWAIEHHTRRVCVPVEYLLAV